MVFCPLLLYQKEVRLRFRAISKNLISLMSSSHFLLLKAPILLAPQLHAFFFVSSSLAAPPQSLGLSSGSDPLKLVCHRAPSCLDSVQSHGFQHYQ